MEQSPPGGGSNLSLAVEALESGRVEQAIQLLQFATSMNPNSGEAHFHLGRAYVARENLALAESSLRHAVDLMPGHAPALCALGKLLARQQNIGEARRTLEACIKADPKCQEARDALDVLPRPEDHLALAGEIDLAASPTSLAPDGGYQPRRLLFAVAGMGLFLVLLLALAFVQIQRIASLRPAPIPAATTGTSWGGVRPRPAPGANGEEAPAQEDEASEEGDGPPASAPGHEADLKQAPYREAAAYLWRLYAAQQDFRAENERYASLAELESLGAAKEGCAAGEPVAACGNASFSEDEPTGSTFAIRAALPDGEALVVDQEGKIRKE